MSDWRERVIADPKICHGKPCIKGTRIFAAIILGYLAEGLSEEDILADYPALTHEDIQAALGYAAALAQGHAMPRPAEVTS